MGLWVDKNAPRIEDLERMDQNVRQVATAEQIEVGGLIAEAQEEISSELKLYLERATGVPEPSLDDVAVTDRLRRWACLVALSFLYRNAYFNQMTERYAARWKEYVAQAERAKRENFEAGVGRVSKPVRRPAAPVVVAVSSGSMSTGAYFLCVSAANGDGDESEASDVATLATSATGGMQIQFGTGSNVAGWNVYAGGTADAMVLQTLQPVAPGAVWSTQTNIRTDGRSPGSGQTSDFVTKKCNRILRG